MAMSKNQVYEHLSQLLEKQTVHFQSLLNTIAEEKNNLLEKPEALDEILHKKLAHVEKLERLGLAQSKLLINAGFTNDETGMEACLHWCTLSSELFETFARLKHLVSQCKESNLVNGALLEMSRFKATQMLNILTQGNNGRSTYNAGGQSTQDNQDGSLSIKA